MASIKINGPLTVSRLKSVLNYDPDTGLFTWIENRRSTNIGKVAGCLNAVGYWFLGIDNKRYLAHRVAWMYMNGSMPEKEIDHINGNRIDNRICNLRLASRSENSRNTPKYKNNKSGFKGVYFDLKRGAWIAKCWAGGKQRSVGKYPTAEQASNAYKAFAEKHHGDFFNPG